MLIVVEDFLCRERVVVNVAVVTVIITLVDTHALLTLAVAVACGVATAVTLCYAMVDWALPT